VQLVRFAYKQTKNVNAKILKNVKFAMELDLYDMCTPALKKRLEPMRGQLKDWPARWLIPTRRHSMIRSRYPTTLVPAVPASTSLRRC
jgi:hypothetical protein